MASRSRLKCFSTDHIPSQVGSALPTEFFTTLKRSYFELLTQLRLTHQAPDSSGDCLAVERIHHNSSIAHYLRQSCVIGHDRYRSTGHRFQRGESKPFIKGDVG